MAEVVLLDSINPSAREIFEADGLVVDTYEKSVTADQLAEKTDGARVLGVRSGPEVPAHAMSDSLEVIAVFGVGVNHIDRSESAGTRRTPGSANERGIPVINSAHENTRSVAELVMGGTYALMRDIGGHNRAMHGGTWTKTDGREVRGKTMGIVGYGAIGLQVSGLAEANGMDVVYFDPDPKVPPQGRATRLPNLTSVLAASDVLTLHVPGGSDGYLIDSAAIQHMKRGSCLINAARGELVDYAAVREALDSGQLGGVMVDVYTDGAAGVKEPAKKGDAFDHVLRGHEKATLVPHIGGSTAEAQRSIGATVAAKALAYLNTGSSTGAVNIPNLSLAPLQPGMARLLHIHDNEPGVIAEVSDLVTAAKLNITQTAQKAEAHIGYVAFDVEGKIPQETFDRIARLTHTRRIRTLFADYEDA